MAEDKEFEARLAKALDEDLQRIRAEKEKLAEDERKTEKQIENNLREAIKIRRDYITPKIAAVMAKLSQSRRDRPNEDMDATRRKLSCVGRIYSSNRIQAEISADIEYNETGIAIEIQSGNLEARITDEKFDRVFQAKQDFDPENWKEIPTWTEVAMINCAIQCQRAIER